MGLILIVIGFGWAALGVANLVGVFSPGSDAAASGLQAFGLIFNMALFILPGLAVGGIGVYMTRRRFEIDRAKDLASPAHRLVVLEGGPADGKEYYVSSLAVTLEVPPVKYRDSGRVTAAGLPVWVTDGQS